MKQLNVAFIGCGTRGLGMMKNTLDLFPDVSVGAVCDIVLSRAEEAASVAEEKRNTRPFVTQDYHEVLKLPEIDAVLVMTAWEYHFEITIASMRAGKYTACEVGGAYTLKQCYDLVNTYHETGTKMMLLENCCYGAIEQTVTKIARMGLLGEIVHASGGYHHYLAPEMTYGLKEREHYRLNNYVTRNCENYPTHELGPIAKLLDINRGNRMVSLCAMSSSAKGLNAYINEHAEDLGEYKNLSFSQGDVFTTMIKCARGETIVITLDTTLPRPYSRGFTVHGTKGMYTEFNDSFYFAGNEDHEKADWNYQPQWGNGGTADKNWGDGNNYFQKYKPEIWEKFGDKAEKAGHGGMDYMVLSAFFDSVRNNAYPPIDVYDAAAWMCITALSEESARCGGAPIAIPDFTDGAWTMPRKDKNESIFALDK